uniref:Uncharacterized protein n=1 Tax=Rhizophagus irregularis (strain DAOM 181602 / DAOM 197198 / MUCL 43194) TaxID=747089 RepID=U9TE99_RHIID
MKWINMKYSPKKLLCHLKIFTYAEFFPSNLWSSFDDYKSELEKWLNLHHSNHLKEECYYKLYDEDENVIENIAKQAFPTLSHVNELLFNDIYVYTASVCDIVLNSNYPDIECARKPLERRFQKFKDSLLNNESIELDDSISILREEIPEMKKKVVVEKDNEEEPRSEEAYEQNFNELFDHSD